MSAPVEEMSKPAGDLSATAEQLKGLVARFRLESDEEPDVATESAGEYRVGRPARPARRTS
jgi:hypothetical protein